MDLSKKEIIMYSVFGVIVIAVMAMWMESDDRPPYKAPPSYFCSEVDGRPDANRCFPTMEECKRMTEVIRSPKLPLGACYGQGFAWVGRDRDDKKQKFFATQEACEFFSDACIRDEGPMKY